MEDSEYLNLDTGPSFGGVLGWKVINVGRPNTSWSALHGHAKGDGSYVVGAAGLLGEVLIYDSKAGLWKDISIEKELPLTGIWVGGDDYVAVCGDGGILRRYYRSSGADEATWHADDYQTGVTKDLTAVHGYDKDHLWAVGAQGTMLRLEDGIWKKVPVESAGVSPETAPDLYAVWVDEPNWAFAGGAGQLFQYRDGVLTTFSGIFTGVKILGIYRAPNKDIWIGADKGRVYRILLDGTVVPLANPTVYSLFRAIWPSPAGNIFIGGDNFPLTVWKTPAQGTVVWSEFPVMSPVSHPDRVNGQGRISGLWGVSEEDLFLCTRERQILHYAYHD